MTWTKDLHKERTVKNKQEIEHIKELMNKKRFTPTECTRLLYSIYCEIADEEECESVSDTLIPPLVKVASESFRAFALLQHELNMRLPQIGRQQLEAIMQVLHGCHRQPVRSLLNAIIAGNTDAQICTALKEFNKGVPAEANTGQPTQYILPEQRAVEIQRLLKLHDHITKQQMFLIMWQVVLRSMTTKDQALLEDTCNHTLSRQLFNYLAHTYSGLAMVELELQDGVASHGDDEFIPTQPSQPGMHLSLQTTDLQDLLVRMNAPPLIYKKFI